MGCDSTALNPMPRQSSSSVMVFTLGSLERGLSTGRIDGGECGGSETEGGISVSGGTMVGICGRGFCEGEV